MDAPSRSDLPPAPPGASLSAAAKPVSRWSANMRQHGFLGLFIAVPLIAVLPLPDFWISQLSYIGLYALTCLGLVLLTGVGGLTSFGQAAFVGIGAYTTAWLTVNMGVSPWITLPIGLSITAVSAFVIGIITLRMSGHYLPLATIAWGLSLYYLMGNIDALGKYDGILGIRSLSLFGVDLGQGRGFFMLTWAFVLAAAVALLHLLDSRSGRAIRALRSGALMAESMGISTFRYKVTIFVIAALFACISGWLFAHFQRTVNPSAFGLKMGIEYLFMTVVGGVGHVWGAIAGAALTRLLEDQLQVLLPRLIGTSGSYEVIVFGIALVMMLKYQPDGLWDFVERRLPRGIILDHMKEQALPQIADRFDVRVLERRRPSGVPIRTLEDYIQALRYHHRRKAGKRVSIDPLSEDWNPTFALVEPGSCFLPRLPYGATPMRASLRSSPSSSLPESACPY